MRKPVWSVTTLVRYLKNSLDADINLQSILIKGEISNLTKHRSGHWYFTLKDHGARLSCVMFSSYVKRCNIPVNEGMKVILTANVSIYEAQGSTQLYVTDLQSDGIGDLYLQFEELKSKLMKEGYFNPEHKKELPLYAENIGIISAKEGAAIHDMIQTIQRRWPIAKITFYPSLVQGSSASADMIEKLLEADKHGHDVILLARGGGSIEDLWAFNDENLAKTIYHMHTVIVCGVGHENDITLVDYVCDKRGATPTAAAELVTPDILEVTQRIKMIKNRLITDMYTKIEKEKSRLEHIKDKKMMKDPLSYIQNEQMQLILSTQRLQVITTHLQNYKKEINENHQKLSLLGITFKNRNDQILSRKKMELIHLMEHKLQKTKQQFHSNLKLLDAYSPLKILDRGYSITSNENKIVRILDDVNIQDNIHIRVKDGMICAVVKNKIKE